MTTPKHQRRASGEVAPVPPAAKSSKALAPAAQEGDPAPGRRLEAPGAGLDVPGDRAAEGGEARSGSGSPGSQPEALSGQAFRDAMKAANSARAKGQRQQRARPWSKRDPLRNAVPGARIMPPERKP